MNRHLQNLLNLFGANEAPAHTHHSPEPVEVEGATPRIVSLTCEGADNSLTDYAYRLRTVRGELGDAHREIDRLSAGLAQAQRRVDELESLFDIAIPALIECGPEMARTLKVPHFTVGVTPGRDGAQIILGPVTIQFFPRLQVLRATGEGLSVVIEERIPGLVRSTLLDLALIGLAQEAAGTTQGIATTVDGARQFGAACNGTLPVEQTVTTG